MRNVDSPESAITAMSPNNFHQSDITAAILSGGQGRRLGGRDKGLEPLAGQALVSHVLAAIQSQVGNTLVCTSRNMELYQHYAAVCPDGTCGFSGPLAAITSALGACTTPWLLTVPVDCPQPPTDLVQRLRHADAPIAVAHDGVRRQPLFALYRKELATRATLALANDLPVWRWQNDLGAVEVDFSSEASCFVNLNTEEDFRRWESTHAI